METKINIAEILRNKPHGVKLYSPIFGDCTFCYIKDETSDICVKRQYNEMSYFNFEGLYNTAGECLLFPSKEMHDWNKFSWKKGDVLTNSSGFQIFFDKWLNEDYTEFLGKIKLLGDSHCYDTAYYTLVSEEEALEFIKSVEEINNGKLNRETLEIEKAQPKFQDGDILSCDEDSYTRHTTLILHKDKNITESIVSLIRHKELVKNVPINNFLLSRLYPAREDEKKELFDALAKEGKAWDAEKKQIVDLKPKCEFKPFDKVVVFDELAKKWECGMFSHYSKNYEGKEVITCIGGCTYFKVLSFNEETAKLLGATNNVEG